MSSFSGRGEAPLSFRRAPRGLALRRFRVRLHHATAVAQSYRGDFGSPAFPADDSNKTPSQCTAHASERKRGRAPLCAQGPSASPAHPAAILMPKAREQLARRVPGDVHARWLDLPKAKPATRGATPPAPPPKRRGPLLSSLAREERTSSP